MINDTISGEVPDKIYEYVKKKFGSASFFKTPVTEKSAENIFYKVEVDQGDLLYLLKFDKNGDLLQRKISSAYVSHVDEPYYETEGFYEGNF